MALLACAALTLAGCHHAVTDPKDPAQSGAVKKFFDWGFGNGNDIATGLLYIPLPKTVQDAIRAAWASVPGTM